MPAVTRPSQMALFLSISTSIVPLCGQLVRVHIIRVQDAQVSNKQCLNLVGRASGPGIELRVLTLPTSEYLISFLCPVGSRNGR